MKLSGIAQYKKKKGGLRRIEFGGSVEGSGDDLCDYGSEDDELFEGQLAVDERDANLQLEFYPDRCLSSEPFAWKSERLPSASIKAAKP